MNENWQNDVLTFWFDELTPEQWYASNKELDARITTKFKELVMDLGDQLPEDAFSDADHCLAAIICFDQFTRNIFRGDAQAFASDDKALELAKHIVAKGWDQDMDPHHKQFSYMPFMHAEDADMTLKCVELFKALGEHAQKAAQEHHDIVAQFGRYPHRNDVMGRASTPQEIEYLKDAKRFGQ